MTLDEFYSLYGSCERLHATEVLLTANMIRASQSQSDDFKDWAKFWKGRLRSGVPQKNDAAAFLAEFGKGI